MTSTQQHQGTSSNCGSKQKSYLTGDTHPKIMEKSGFVYIITNKHKTVLYTGVTSDLVTRTSKHKARFYKNSFTDKYNLEYLVYYEQLGKIADAIAREKEIKDWNRQKKIDLINSFNPEWKDLWGDIN